MAKTRSQEEKAFVICSMCGDEVFEYSRDGEYEIMYEHPEAGDWVCASCLNEWSRSLDAAGLAEVFGIRSAMVVELYSEFSL